MYYLRSITQGEADCQADHYALDKDFVSADNAEELIDKHLHVPFAYSELRGNLSNARITAVNRSLQDNGHLLDKIEHSEPVVEINIAEGMVVNGRLAGSIGKGI